MLCIVRKRGRLVPGKFADARDMVNVSYERPRHFNALELIDGSFP